mmetsp:Transcript_16733/g.50161  ORF Transcript_16733/g.50161 Transcript_16733/m.50161 type:complete len:238 (-) Transcript_16733:79-792(-)
MLQPRRLLAALLLLPLLLLLLLLCFYSVERRVRGEGDRDGRARPAQQARRQHARWVAAPQRRQHQQAQHAREAQRARQRRREEIRAACWRFDAAWVAGAAGTAASRRLLRVLRDLVAWLPRRRAKATGAAGRGTAEWQTRAPCAADHLSDAPRHLSGDAARGVRRHPPRRQRRYQRQRSAEGGRLGGVAACARHRAAGNAHRRGSSHGHHASTEATSHEPRETERGRGRREGCGACA